MPRLELSVDELNRKALDVRRDIITLLSQSQSGHTGGSLSCTDFATALLFHEANLDPANPDWPDRDIWHFSIGHVTPVIYSVMAERGYFPLADLLKFRTFDGQLQGHPSRQDTPGLEISAGSLGQGLGFAVGAAKGAKMDNHPRRVFCIMGDGEQQEGSVWEAVMSAAQFELNNLCAIVDSNRMQIDGPVRKVMNIDPLADKYKSFGWNVIEIDGHNMSEILDAFAEAKTPEYEPTVIIAHTVMGRGIDFMEDDWRWHGKPPTVDQARIAMKQLGTTLEDWTERLSINTAPALMTV